MLSFVLLVGVSLCSDDFSIRLYVYIYIYCQFNIAENKSCHQQQLIMLAPLKCPGTEKTLTGVPYHGNCPSHIYLMVGIEIIMLISGDFLRKFAGCHCGTQENSQRIP